MQKISQALTEIFQGNAFLRMGLQERLLNLSQVARFLRPQIEARLKRSVEVSAVTMNLSRLQRSGLGECEMTRDKIDILNITVHSALTVLAFTQSREVHSGIHKLYNKVRRKEGYITVSRGVSEVSVIVESAYCDDIQL